MQKNVFKKYLTYDKSSAKCLGHTAENKTDIISALLVLTSKGGAWQKINPLPKKKKETKKACKHMVSKQHAAAAAKSLQSCLTLGDPTDSSPPGSPIPGISQARILEWVAMAFSGTTCY